MAMPNGLHQEASEAGDCTLTGCCLVKTLRSSWLHNGSWITGGKDKNHKAQ